MTDLYLKSVASVVPGVGEGEVFGVLYPVEELLQKMTPQVSLPDNWVRDKMGFETVAISNYTLERCKRLWNGSVDGGDAYAFASSSCNSGIYGMLETAISRVFAANVGSKVVRHFHVAPTFGVSSIFRIRDVLSRVGVPVETPTIYIPEGCSGFLTALDLTSAITRGMDDADVLVTAETDMSLYSHQRSSVEVTIEDVDQWIWGAIFGDGVGAALVGRHPGKGGYRISRFHQDIVERDWRVYCAHRMETQDCWMEVRSAAVKKTYIEFITSNARALIDDVGGVNELSFLCLHESNPRIVEMVARSLAAC